MINTTNPFIRRLIKKSLLDTWEGQKASQAPLFFEYILSKKRKHDAWMNLKIGLMANQITEGRRRYKETGTAVAITDDIELEVDGESIATLPYENLNDQQRAFIDWLRQKISDAYGNQKLRAYDESDYASLFEYLPKDGETVLLRKTAYKVVQITMQENGMHVVVARTSNSF